MDVQDTICAVATPKGHGGIAVIRVSGPEAVEIVDRLWRGKRLGSVTSHTAHLGTVTGPDGEIIDQCVATLFRGPRSYTGEDVVELSVHGSTFVQRELLAALVHSGARLAEPGEYTRRAFTSGRLDLAQAEAVADVIAAESRAAHRIAVNQMRGGFSRRLTELRGKLVDLSSLLELELDFSEEEVEFASREKLHSLADELMTEISRLHGSFRAGNAIKNGIPVAIIGPTNAGKSSLLNALLGDDRAIVSDIHGTTRDTIEETLEIGDYLFRFIDTAGLRDTEDKIERIGIERSRRELGKASIIINVSDSSGEIDRQLMSEVQSVASRSGARHILILNKIDLNNAADMIYEMGSGCGADYTIPLSAKTGQGIDTLKETLIEIAASNDASSCEDGVMVTNARHQQALYNAMQSCRRMIDGLDSGLPGDLLAQDLRETIHHLSAITGEIPSTEILSTIFSRFCIGK